MRAISRRSILGGGVALLATSRAFAAETTERLDVPANEGPVTLTLYAASQAGKRASVVVLHGARGVELKPLAYERFANKLTAEGIDVYLAHYYRPCSVFGHVFLCFITTRGLPSRRGAPKLLIA